MAQPAIDQLNALLSAAYDRAVRICATERIAPWALMRCTLEAAGVPKSVVVKWVRDDPTGFRGDIRQAATERAALEFLAEIGFSRAPRLIAADLDAGLLILEDLAPRAPLHQQVLDRGADALANELLDFASASGALGAATAGRQAQYEAIRRRHGEPDPAVGRARALGPDWPEGRAALEALGPSLSTAADRDVAAMAQTLLDPGPFSALSNGDPHPNNFLTDGNGGRLMDFEFADFRHAAASAVWIHTPGVFFLTVAPAMVDSLEAAYRGELARGVPEAENDRPFGFGMAAAALTEACRRIARFPVLDTRPVGDGSRLHRVAVLEAAVRAARRHGALLDLAGWVEQTALWLRRRWPDTDVDLTALGDYAPRT